MPAASDAVTRTTPSVPIEIPVPPGDKVKVSVVPVPPAAINATEESARPNVVVIPDPPFTVIGALTVMTNESVPVAEAESVAVIVSR